MTASSVTGKGNGSAAGKSRNKENRESLVIPRMVASGVMDGVDSEILTIILPKILKYGIENYVVTVTAESPVVADGGELVDDTRSFAVTKLDDRWTQGGEDEWVYDEDAVAGKMKGFAVRASSTLDGGEDVDGSFRIMWTVSTIGYDMTAFDD